MTSPSTDRPTEKPIATVTEDHGTIVIEAHVNQGFTWMLTRDQAIELTDQLVALLRDRYQCPDCVLPSERAGRARLRSCAQ